MVGRESSERPPLQSRGFVFSAAAVGLLVVAAVFLVVATIVGQRAPSAARSAAVRVTSGSVPGEPVSVGGGAVLADDPRGCSLPAGSQSVPVAAPASGWALVGSMAAPTAPSTIGPEKSIDGVRMCFARSPAGALFAAASFWAEATAVPQTVLYRQLAAATPARAVAVAQAQGKHAEVAGH